MNIDFGLSVIYDGKKYILMSPDNVCTYPVGGLICEYCTLSPTDIKSIIFKCSQLNEEANCDNLTESILEFHAKLFDTFSPVIATMISLEFQHSIIDFMQIKQENRLNDIFQNLSLFEKDDKIIDFILKDTVYKSLGCETVLQSFLSAYYFFIYAYIETRYTFEMLVGKKDETKTHEEMCKRISAFYGKHMDFQHIDFRIINTDEYGLASVYTIKSSFSLLLFEIANAIQNNQNFVVCKNCNSIFIPEGRSDTVYCSSPSPQNKNKTCREIGAQIARANKEKNDIVTSTYRKTYMRHKMMTKRHPYDRDKLKRFEDLTNGMKEWRIKLNNGSATTEDFMKWIEQF